MWNSIGPLDSNGLLPLWNSIGLLDSNGLSKRNINKALNRHGNFNRSLDCTNKFLRNGDRNLNGNINRHIDKLRNTYRDLDRNLTGDITPNLFVLRNRKLTRNRDSNGNLDRNINVPALLNRVRTRNLNGNFHGNFDRNLNGDRNFDGDLDRRGRTSHNSFHRDGNFNTNLNGLRNINGNLNRSRSSGDNLFDSVRNVNGDLNLSGNSYTHRNLNWNINVVDNFDVVRSGYTHFNGNRNFNRNLDRVRTLDRNFYRVRTSNGLGNADRNGLINPHRDVLELFEVTRTSYIDNLVNSVRLPLNDINRDSFATNVLRNNLTLSERNVSGNGLLNSDRNWDRDIKRLRNANIIRDRDLNLLIHVSVTVLVDGTIILDAHLARKPAKATHLGWNCTNSKD